MSFPFELPGYTLIRQLGSGGMATVYLATQQSFKRQVAIKVLLPAYAQDAEFAQRFLREASIVASLSHPHIIPVYDFGQREGTFYMVMEYLPGGDLGQWIQHGLDEREVLQITGEIAAALHFAHEKGYVHRDVKPDNVMFREDNSAVLTDFGIARQKNANDQLTVAGAILGTPKYMSPEQLQGHELDGRSDLYSLGILFYEMFARHAPYEDPEFMALAMKHLKAPIPKLPLPAARFQKLFEKMVAKQPQHRFQTGMEIAKLIEQIRSGRLDPASIDSKGVADPVKPVPAGASKPAIREGLVTEELETKSSWFSKKYRFTARATAVEWARLNVTLDALNTQLIEWHAARKRGCEAVEVQVTTREENFAKVRSRIKAWGNVDPGKFLHRTGLRLVLKEVDSGREQASRLSW